MPPHKRDAPENTTYVRLGLVTQHDFYNNSNTQLLSQGSVAICAQIVKGRSWPFVSTGLQMHDSEYHLAIVVLPAVARTRMQKRRIICNIDLDIK